MSDGSDVKTLCSGWLDHKDKKGNYNRLWVVLEGNVMFIFRNEHASLETQIGNLTLTKATEFHIKQGGSASKGYKFDLHTADKENTFKTKKLTERELWRGYIVGITKHKVPTNLDLLEPQIQQIRDDIAQYHGDTHSRRGYRRSIRSERSEGVDSGVGSVMGSMTDGRSINRSTRGSDIGSTRGSESGSHSSPSTLSDTLSAGGPTQVHMFYNDRRRSQPPPSWFVPHCSRETAEKLLQRANSLDYGNTLMRESTTFLENGSYVISRIFVNTNGSISYDHYEVIRTSGGYKINVQNEHAPMKCLYDVLEYYITVSESGTKPILTNDLATLGHDVPGYATQINNPTPKPAESWQWPPGGGGATGGAGDASIEPEPDYDDAESVTRPLSVDVSKQMDGSNTLSPGILRRPSRNTGTVERKSVGWNSVVNTPPPLPHHHTYAPGTKQTRPAAPTVDEFKQRQRETDELNDFDQMLGSFERSSMYVNTPARAVNGQARIIGRPGIPVPPPPSPPPPPPPPPEAVSLAPDAPLPPPPAPHKQYYINQDEPDSVALLPVAPPPPRDPIVYTKTPTPAKSSPTSSVSSANRFITPQKPQTNLSPLRHSSSMLNSSGVKHTPSNLGHSSSDGQLKQHVVSPSSPQTFPVWNNNSKKTNNVTSSNVPNKVNGIDVVHEHQHEDTREGVDEHNPGGVSTLRDRFNQMASSPSTPAAKKGRGRQSLPVTWSLTSLNSQQGENDLQENLPTQSTNHSYNKTNINKVAKQSASQTKQTSRRQSEPFGSHNLAGGRRATTQGDDVIYDDTALPEEPKSAEGKRAQFVRQSTEPTVVNRVQTNPPPASTQGPPTPAPKPAGGDRLTQRRKTEPSVNVSRVHFEVPTSFDDTTGFNEDFKKKLGATLFGQAPQGPQGAQGAGRGVPRTPTSPRNSQFPRVDTEEHLYQELPDIEPDGVTYVNERFNTETTDFT